MAKNFLIGGLSGMIATSCVCISRFNKEIDLTNGYDQGPYSVEK